MSKDRVIEILTAMRSSVQQQTNTLVPNSPTPHIFRFLFCFFVVVQGIQMYNLSFDRMVKMFEGERTQKQLKNKFEKEMRDHPDMVHRALSTQITKGPW